MTAYQAEVKSLKEEFLKLYGGMMSVTDLARELGVNRESAKRWAEEKRIGNNTVMCIGGRVKYDTRLVAKEIVNGRGFA